jgi:hypothetical protein
MTADLPTPDQQRATADRYRGQRARRAYEPTEIPSAPHPAPPPRVKGAWKQALWRLLIRATWISVLALAIGIVLALLNTNHGSARSQVLSVMVGVLVAPIFIMVVIWMLVILGGIFWSIHTNLKVATKPIPSLAEIDARLRAEGYDPSLQDLMAVEQHLKSERNEAALIAGGLIIGLQAMARQAKGKPPF